MSHLSNVNQPRLQSAHPPTRGVGQSQMHPPAVPSARLPANFR
jgi:hypothetical protein